MSAKFFHGTKFSSFLSGNKRAALSALSELESKIMIIFHLKYGIQHGVRAQFTIKRKGGSLNPLRRECLECVFRFSFDLMKFAEFIYFITCRYYAQGMMEGSHFNVIFPGDKKSRS